MASELTIKADIERLVSTYSLWAVGTTDDPAQVEGEHGSPSTWRSWDAGDHQTASTIESHFIAKGMEADNRGRFGRTKFVYIFMGLQASLESVKSVRQRI